MKEQAPKNKTWVCAACGKHHKDRYKVGDASCYLNSVLCKDKKRKVDGEMTWIISPE